MNPDDDDLLTEQEAADRVGISLQGFRRIVSTGAITASAGKRGKVYAAADVHSLMKERHDAALARHPEGREALALAVVDHFWPYADSYERQPDTSIKVVRQRGDNNQTLMNKDKA